MFAAERFDHAHAALAVLFGPDGLRVSEACATNVATFPLVLRTARTIDLAIGERHDGPILRRLDGERLDRRTAHRWVRAIGRRAGLGMVHPHMLRAAFIMAALDAGVPLREVQSPHGIPNRVPPSSTTDVAKISTATGPKW